MSDRRKHDLKGNYLNSTETHNNPFVVGIGASAGGLTALEELFAHLPVDSGAAFVVIQHLSPDFKSLMKELLQRHTDMAVYRVTEGMELKPNSVYLIPPGKNLTLEDNLLKLEERKKDKNDKHKLNFPIDLFFTSLANNCQEQAIGVILSGSGSDGTWGLRAINEAGGVALVQDPETAEFDGMPRSAINTGVVNQILPLRELAQLIHQCIVSPLDFLEGESSEENSLLTNSSLKKIADLLVETENIDFSYYKSSTMSRRIHRRRLINNYQNLDSYIDFLRDSDQERKILCSDLLINVTHFFRNPAAWENLEKNILPALIEQTKPQEELRFWVTACSTGEEAYSLTILIHEALQNANKPLSVRIFATDVDRVALKKASLGIYPYSIANDITPERLHKYFVAKNNCYQVIEKLRKMLIFSPQDLTKEVGFTRMNLISCRNVLIYMQPNLQQQVLRNFHFSLVVKGTLFLGEAESVGTFEPEFEPLDKKWKIYQKRRDIRLPLSLKTIPRITVDSSVRSGKSPISSKNQPVPEQSLLRILQESNSVILLVSQDNQLLHVYGDSSTIFKPLHGEIVTEVTKMVVLPLQIPLNTALNRAKKEKKSIVYTSIQLEQSSNLGEAEALGDRYNISLKVIPPQPDQANGDFYLVQIEQKAASLSPEVPQAEKFELSNEAQRRVIELEQELQYTRENLQESSEELTAFNEEQQASNEELTASNEELQSTNEELHSVNEELHTVNAEYQTKIQELTQLNNDIDNLLKSTEIGVIFLDSKLKIRKFTPAATKAVSLRETDLERPLEELTLKIECPQLPELLKQVLEEQHHLELEVKLREENSYLLMGIHPYHTEERQNDGIVISFVKVDQIKAVQLQLESTLVEKNRQLTAIETASEGIAILNDDKFVYVNQAHLKMFGYSKPEELIGQSWQILYEPEQLARFEQEVFPLLQEKGQWNGITKAKHHDGYLFDEEITLTFTEKGDLICICRDISDRLTMECALKESEQKYRYIYENTPVMLHSIDDKGRIINVSDYWLIRMGYTREEVIGRKSTEFLLPESQKYAREVVLPEYFRTGYCQNVLYHWVSKNGQIIDGLMSAISEQKENKIVRSLAVIIDVTELRQARQKLVKVNTELEQRVTERTQTLATFSDRLKQLHRLSRTEYQQLDTLFADYLQAGCQILNMSTGIVSKVKNCIYQIVAVQSPLDLAVGHEVSCYDTYCAEVVDTLKTVTYHQVGAIESMREHPVYLNLKLESFIGTPILVNGNLYGTLNFSNTIPRERGFSQEEIEIVELMARDIGQFIASVQSKIILRNSESFFRNTFEQAAVGIAHVSPEGKFIKVNQRLCQIVGYERNPLIKLTFQEITHPEDLAADLEYVRQLLAGEINSYSMEKRYIHRDRSIVWINLTACLVRNYLKEPEYFIAVIEDISDRKQTEMALNESQESEEKLQLVNQAKDAFIAHMSHELRTPLNSILGFSSILQKDSYLTSKQLNSVNIVHQSGQHLLTLINDILDLSKITAKKMRLEPKKLHLIQFLSEISTIFSLRAQQKGLNLSTEISSSLPTAVNADETRLRQVLFNLLSNAVKFTETGSVTFKVGYVEDFSRQGVGRDGEDREEIFQSPITKIRFQIEDTGRGIPADKFATIFTPFGQVKGNTGNFTGTGLGLTISQDIIKLMGSEIKLESQVSQGSKFWFDLELLEVDANTVPTSSEFISQPSRRLCVPCKVLVVDDHKNNRTLLVNYLQPMGFILAEANNGEEGLAMIDTFQPDAILVDLVMPVMDGKEMITKMKQQPLLQDIVIIMISANSQMIRESSAIDYHGFLSKPVNLEQLSKLLDSHLQLNWQSNTTTTEPEPLSTSIVAPPQEELSKLSELANIGDMEAIEEQINSLEASDSQYISFVQEVRQLAHNFQQHKLEIFIKNFIDSSN